MSLESKVAVLPGGEMGTAMALKARANGHNVSVWIHSDESFAHFQKTNESKHLPGFKLDGISVSQHMAEVLEDVDVIFFAPRSSHFMDNIRQARPFIDGNPKKPLLGHGSKGFTDLDGKISTFSQVIEREIPESRDKIFVVSGPNFADQIASGIITGTTIAAYNKEVAEEAKKIFHNGTFQVDVYKGSSPVDVEIVGAFKNVVALVMGFARTLDNYGENTGALVLKKGLSEAALLCEAMGGDPKAIMEFCGVGDYGLLMNSNTSRNVQAGEAFGRGEKTLDELMNSGTTYEGIAASRAVRLLFRQHRVKMPLALSAYRVLYNRRDPKDVVRRLLETV